MLEGMVLVLKIMFSVKVSCKTFLETDDSDHRPLHHFDIKAEALIDGVRFPPNARLELKHLRLVHDHAILKINKQDIIKYKWKGNMTKMMSNTFRLSLYK